MGVDKRIGQPLADYADELLNADTNLRHGWMNLFICIIGPYRLSMVSFVTPPRELRVCLLPSIVMLSEAKGLARWADRCFASLSMTGLERELRVCLPPQLSP